MVAMTKKKIDWSKLSGLGGYLIAMMDVKIAVEGAKRWSKKGTRNEKISYLIGALLLTAIMLLGSSIADLNPTYTTVTGAITRARGWLPAFVLKYTTLVAYTLTLAPMTVEFVLSRMAIENISKTRPVLTAAVLFDLTTDTALALAITNATMTSMCGSIIVSSTSSCYMLGESFLASILFWALHVGAFVLVLLVCSFYLEALAIISAMTAVFFVISIAEDIKASRPARRNAPQGRGDDGDAAPPASRFGR